MPRACNKTVLHIAHSEKIWLCEGSQLYLHGGLINILLEDLFEVDLSGQMWTLEPTPRHGHLMTVHADKLVMLRGYDELELFRCHVLPAGPL